MMDLEAIKSSTEGNLHVFYRGVVEDINDPEKMGRVRVRIFGIHSESKEEVPTETLPWAEVIQSSNFGLITGVGLTALPMPGNYVWVFFDNGDYNFPVVIGCTAGKRILKDKVSFNDKENRFPISSRLEEPDTNRTARNFKPNETPQGIKSQDPKVLETIDLYTKAKYPHNKVLETETGHVIEIDDSPGNERINVFHRTGTHVEFQPDGKLVIKSINDRLEVVIGNQKVHITGNRIEFIDGNVEQTVLGNVTIKISGNLNIITEGTTTFNSGGDFVITAPTIYEN